MLSDEEKQAIEGLKGSQKWIRQQIRLGNLPDYNQGHYADIQIVLNLIEKQSKEIEELKAHQIIFTNDYKPIGSKERKFISEDKIKAKIEELDKQEKEVLKGTKGQDRYAIKQEYMHKRSALQSLLEKE